MREFLRENADSIRHEAYAAYWWCRCKSAATVAQVALVLIAYCRWRGKRARIAAFFARMTCSVARRLMPAPLRQLVE